MEQLPRPYSGSSTAILPCQKYSRTQGVGALAALPYRKAAAASADGPVSHP